MQKLAYVFVLSMMFALACSSDIKAFEDAFWEWTVDRADAYDLFKQCETSFYYFQLHTGNTTCAQEVMQQLETRIQQAADQWDADKSKLGEIASNLLNVVLPSFIVKFKLCVIPDIFRRDEANFDNATTQVFEQNPLIKKTYDAFSDVIGFLTKGQLPVNTTCVNLVANLIEYYRLGGITQYFNAPDAYTIIAKLVYAKTTNFTRMAQRCLTGPAESNFNNSLSYYLQKNPEQKALYDQEDSIISTLTKTLPHDEKCVKKISDKLTARLSDAYTSFGSDMATISELAGQFLYVYLPEAISDARNCLTN